MVLTEGDALGETLMEALEEADREAWEGEEEALEEADREA